MACLCADYSFMAEHTDLRHIMGVGIAITRGSAASLSFCYSILLLSMCRNLLTKLKEFSIQQYIPLDSHIQFHKIAACTALFFSLLHTVGHIVNFYHVSTQPIENLRCLTNEIRFPSDYKPDITFWLFQTITGKWWGTSGLSETDWRCCRCHRDIAVYCDVYYNSIRPSNDKEKSLQFLLVHTLPLRGTLRTLFNPRLG